MGAPEAACDLGQSLGTYRAAGCAFEALDQPGDGEARWVCDQHVEMVAIRLDGGDGGTQPRGGGAHCTPQQLEDSLAHDAAPILGDEHQVGKEGGHAMGAPRVVLAVLFHRYNGM